MGLIFLMSHFQVLLMRHFQGSEDLDGHVQVSQVWISHFQVSQGLDEVCFVNASFSSLSRIG
jgi:hypothetical protein